MPTSLKLMLFFWQVGLVDTFSLIQFCINTGSQYGAIVLASAAGNFSDIGPKVLCEPIIGLGTSYQFIRAAQTAAERRARIATLAAFLSASGASAVTTDPATNAALGGAIASKIAYMRAILTRGGGGGSYNIAKSISSSSLEISSSSLEEFAVVVNSVKTPVLDIHPYRTEFTYNSKMIINNMFQEHTARRYLQGSAQKIKTVAPLAPMASTVNTTALIGWTCLGVGLISFTILGSLYLFQRAERKRWQNQNDEVLIDITASLSE
jgi:hypothetical protein